MEEYPNPNGESSQEGVPAKTGPNMNLVLGAIMVWLITGAVAIAALTGRSAPQAKPAVTAGAALPSEIAWTGSFEEAMQRSKTEHKPVMVDFYTSWCGACKWLDANTYTEPSVIAETGSWIVVKVDAEQREDVARQYGISAYPTLAFLRGDGQPLDYIVGAPDANDLITHMRNAQAKFTS